MHPGCGRFAMLESVWDRMAADVHRWVVQRLGASLLTFLAQEEP